MSKGTPTARTSKARTPDAFDWTACSRRPLWYGTTANENGFTANDAWSGWPMRVSRSR